MIHIAEFAWSKVEPGGRCFLPMISFDEFLDLCSEKQMKSYLRNTYSNSSAWLTEKYPEVLNARKDGVLLRHGGRRHYNYNSPVYQKLCARVVERSCSLCETSGNRGMAD
ncbi:MAG: beta-galactosidase [Anaerobutyricum sp.]